ncbi:MAG TPA: hypothetical protein VFM56_12610, partial [Solimonas sp.]|nr:hypothetical protein [Solimonas sp.]
MPLEFRVDRQRRTRRRDEHRHLPQAVLIALHEYRRAEIQIAMYPQHRSLTILQALLPPPQLAIAQLPRLLPRLHTSIFHRLRPRLAVADFDLAILARPRINVLRDDPGRHIVGKQAVW